MNVNRLACDYLVIGAGAASLAFIDTLITELPSVKIILVDKNPLPGGHWQHAYDYVHLHQPSVVYGLASKQLEGSWKKLIFRKRQLPWKHRASKKEIVKYYGDFVKEKLVNRNLIYYPNCVYDFEKGYSFSSLDETFSYEVKVREKVVNGVLGQCIIPSQNPLQFPVDDGVIVMTPNDIYNVYNKSRPINEKKFVVLGAGKTSMDTVVYLQRVMKVRHEHIHWVIPNDVWMISREGGGTPWSKAEAILEFDGDEEKAINALEERGVFVRLDQNVTPTRFRFPVIGNDELKYLRKVKNIIRKGRVSSIKLTSSMSSNAPYVVTMHFDRPTTDPQEFFGSTNEYVFVHCSSPGPFNGIDIKELFVSDNHLDLYLLYAPPVSISMSVIGYLEAARKKEDLDLNLGAKLMAAIRNVDVMEKNSSEEKKEDYDIKTFKNVYSNSSEKVSENDILKAIVLPLKVTGQHENFSSLVNLAIFLAIADTDPMVPYNWMRGNRLSFLSIPFFKCNVFENLDKMVSKGPMLGFSKDSIEIFRLLRDKLEPLKGK